MSFNAPSSFPEYYDNSNEEIYPDKDVIFSGWVLLKDNTNQKLRT